jgi:hypothetical protein
MVLLRPGSFLACAALAAAGLLVACSKSNTDTAPATAPAAAPAPTTPAAPTTYTINLTPPWKVGQKFGYVGEETNTDPDGHKSTVHLEAHGVVLELLPDGDPQTVEYIVTTLKVASADISPAEVPVTGSRIVTQYTVGDKLLIIANSHAVSDNLHDALEDILTLTGPRHPDQEVLGTTAPVAVAANWPINATAYMDNQGPDQGPPLKKVAGTMILGNVQGAGREQIGTVTGVVNSEAEDPGDATGEGRASVTSKVGITETFPFSGQGVFTQNYLIAQTMQPLRPNGQAAGPPETSTDELLQQVTIP